MLQFVRGQGHCIQGMQQTMSCHRSLVYIIIDSGDVSDFIG